MSHPQNVPPEVVSDPGPRTGSGPDRRTVLRAAAWSAPVIAVAIATPLASASDLDVGAYTLTGTCGVPGSSGPGFLLTAGPTTALPIGTSVLIIGRGVANIGVFSVQGGTANVATLSSTARQVTLTAALPAGNTLSMRTTLSTTVTFNLDAGASLPDGYVSTGAKTTASVVSSFEICSGI